MLRITGFLRLVDEIMNNENTEVAVINIYCNGVMMSKQANIQVFRKESIRIPRSSICFSTTHYIHMYMYVQYTYIRTCIHTHTHR